MAKATTEAMTEKKKCFVISPIGEPDSDTRIRADKVLNTIIKPAIEKYNYITERADEIDKPGIITNQVIQCVVDSYLVIADLTDQNPNVFYELAIRHALRKPFIQLIDKNQEIPFDVYPTRTVFIDHITYDGVSNAKDEIIKQIDFLEANPEEIETPISSSLDLKELRQSKKPVEKSLADIIEHISEIKYILSKLEIQNINIKPRRSLASMSNIDIERNIERNIERSIERSIERNIERLQNTNKKP